MVIAVIKNSKCINTIICESVELAEALTKEKCVELPDGFGIDDTYENENWVSLNEKREPWL